MDQPRYQHCRWIGAVAFGKVYRAIDTKINCVVALKHTELEGDGNDGSVPADVVLQDGKRLTLVFEFMDGDLLEFMKAHPDRFSDSNLIKCTTHAYSAPEVLLGSTEHYVAADMWSVGCIFAEMVNQDREFEEGS
ncbi:cyclin-dependent kinase A-1-like isoform X1 [Populus alba x Populus x berolinensis]|uniref:cyclin-dependent kinase n=1 Tax=Populus alba x Populus x berolinensis TaxID=444605 RepID=A0AAD6MP87_9ROSI|nr:cyclin-dependent kinase A-1-like isoform X1 [Populus alba x Populus x berolinensis]